MKEVKQKIFEEFWNFYMKTFQPKIGQHGTLEDVNLRQKEIEITTDESLQKRLSCSTVFQVVFKEH